MKTFEKTIKETEHVLYVFAAGAGLNKGLNFLTKVNKTLGVSFDSVVVTDIWEARRIAKNW